MSKINNNQISNLGFNTSIIPIFHHQVSAVRQFLQEKEAYEIFPPQVCHSMGHPFVPALPVSLFGEDWTLQQGCRYYLIAAMHRVNNAYSLISSFRNREPPQENRLLEFKYLEATFLGSYEDSLNLATELFEELVKSNITNKLQGLPSERVEYLQRIKFPLPVISFEEATKVLKSERGKKLTLAQECSLTKHYDDMPVIVTEYPEHLKPNIPDTRWKSGSSNLLNFSIIAPLIGSFIDGGEYEVDVEILSDQLMKSSFAKALKKREPSLESMYNYIKVFEGFKREDSFAFFGLGFERMVQYLLGVKNAKDASFCPVSGGSGTISQMLD